MINDPDPNGDRIFRNLLYVEEERLDRLSNAIRSLGDMDRIKLRGIFDEILADG